MENKPPRTAPANSVPTESEIEAATQRLSADWARPVARSSQGGSSHIVQSLSAGRTHAVTVEVKRQPPRRRQKP